MAISRSWLDVARSAFLEELYRGRSVLCIGVGDGRGIEVLLDRGAAKVVGVDANVAEAGRRLGRRAELRSGSSATVNGRFDLVMVADGESLFGGGEGLDEVCAKVANGGWLVVSAANGDRAGQGNGLGYYQLADALAPHFPSVTMLGAAPLMGAALAPFGEDAQPIFDGQLARSEAQLYVAIGGPRALSLGYGVIALPEEASVAGHDPAELARVREEARNEITKIRGELARVGDDLKRAHRERDEGQNELKRVREEAVAGRKQARDDAQAELKRAREELQLELKRAREEQAATARGKEMAEASLQRIEKELRAQVAQLNAQVMEERRRADGSLTAELSERLSAREHGVEEMKQSALLHAEKMRAMEARLDERDAYVAEMEESLRGEPGLRAALAKAEARADAAESAERAARLQAARLAGALVKHGIAAPEGVAPVDDGRAAELEKQVAELSAKVTKLETKAADAQREAWASLKARSEAEAQAAEVREDTVRKLKDARKVANIELMRAMEEATRKAVSLKEELTRTEAERREALAALKGMREEHAQLAAEVERLRALERGASPSVSGLREEIERLEELVTGEGARLGGIEESLRRAVAAVAAAELDLSLDGGRR